MENRTMPICCTADQYKKIEQFAKNHGMINPSQVIEKLLEEE